ncbi:MAG: 3'-5' exonuclease [Atopobiaceae bacterium]|nr:3'-5' exonuclease [Atopobiaceae bacterium]
MMYAISKTPSPILTGAVEIDDTFLREDQKASRHLVNPLSKDILKKRKPRKHKVKPILGTRGNEYATITTAMDDTGHCVCRVLACGAVPEEILGDFITEHTKNISFICSDAEDTYRRVFAKLNIAHYIHPSEYKKIITQAGIITNETPNENGEPPDEDDETGLTQEQKDRNDVIRERLWSKGQIDRIANRGKMSYEMFRKLKRENHLTINRVNRLHATIKKWFKTQTTGVSTKYLPLYIAWFEYTHNKEIDKKQRYGDGASLASRKDAEDILIEAMGTRANLTYEEIEQIRHNPLTLPKASGRYLHMLERLTAKIRIELRDPDFYYGDENGSISFDKKRLLASMSDAQLRELATRLKMKGWHTLKRSALIEELRKHPDIKDHLYIVAVNTSGSKDENGNYNYKHNRPLLNALYPKDDFIAPEDAEGNIVFLDTETTGLDKNKDEILQLTVISLEGEVLYDKLIKPKFAKRWGKAQILHGISPYDVQDAPTMEQEKEAIEAILAEADVIVGWNVRFDLDMLYANGIDVPIAKAKYCDLMPWYYKAYKRRSGWLDISQKKLENATTYLEIEHKPHNAQSDTAVLIPIWKWVLDDSIPEVKGKPQKKPF